MSDRAILTIFWAGVLIFVAMILHDVGDEKGVEMAIFVLVLAGIITDIIRYNQKHRP